MNKYSGINVKILTGWLLLLLFALPPAAKTVHICQCVYDHNVEHEKNNSHTHHDYDACAICQFVLFPFTETESPDFICAVEAVYYEPFTYCENIISSVKYNYMLRAPPCA
ncbi:MAG: hypothetical protein LBE04_04960 [Prevotellaceae bacterium]|jgi:hypothetical protein|nr:hypothetical protein [Prevotellaceae bacterium]